MSTDRGVYGKYIITKADGTDVDPEACYFVLRLDTDHAARAAMRAYAEATENKGLASGITRALDRLESGPCGCRSVGECYHDMLGSPIWRHGGTP